MSPAHTSSPASGSIRPEYPAPSHFLVHISDAHVGWLPGGVHGGIDAAANLKQLLDGLVSSNARPGAIVFTGDLTNHGDAGSYATLRQIVEPAAEAMGARIIWTMGNHDDRENLRAALLGVPGNATSLDETYLVDGLRIVTLDTTVPGFHHGEVSDEQLRWLASELSEPAPHGTILAMHHPPIPSVLDLAVMVELRGQPRLADVLRGTDVRSILAGHLHYSTTATFAGIPVSVAAASCYTQDLNAPAGRSRGRDAGQAYSRVHVFDHTVVHSVVPVAAGVTVGEYLTPEQAAGRISAAGIRLR